MRFKEMLGRVKLEEDFRRFITSESKPRRKILSIVETCHLKFIDGDFDQYRATRGLTEAVEFGAKIFNETDSRPIPKELISEEAESILKNMVLSESATDSMILSAAKTQFPEPMVSVEYVNHQPFVLVKVVGNDDFGKYFPNTFRIYNTGEFKEPRLTVYLTGTTTGVTLYALRGTLTKPVLIAQTNPEGQDPTNALSNRMVGTLHTEIRVQTLQHSLKRLEGET